MPVVTLRDESKLRGDFYVPRFEIKIAGVNLPLDVLRGRNLCARHLQELRYRIIRQAARAGHPGVAIASFFRMSPSRVSEIIRSSPEILAMAGRANSDAPKGGP